MKQPIQHCGQTGTGAAGLGVPVEGSVLVTCAGREEQDLLQTNGDRQRDEHNGHKWDFWGASLQISTDSSVTHTLAKNCHLSLEAASMLP